MSPSARSEPNPFRLTARALATTTAIAVLLLLAADPAVAEEVGMSAGSPLPAWAQAAIESLRGISPLLFFGAFVVATFLPLPVALFYFTAGVVYGVEPALAWIAGSLTVSNLILHSLSRSLLRPQIEAFVARRGYRVPRFDSPLDEILFITFIRLTPGVPYFLQNLILAVARLDLIRFVVLSVGIQMIYVTGFVVLGRSALDGKLGKAIGGLALVVAVAAVARLLAAKRAGRSDDPDGPPSSS